jgi:hypothetical protein
MFKLLFILFIGIMITYINHEPPTILCKYPESNVTSNVTSNVNNNNINISLTSFPIYP